MADFAFTRQDETKIASETTKIVPLTCHGHSRPITHLSFSGLLPGGSNNGSSPNNGTSATSQYYIISACKDNNPMLRDGLTGDWIGTFIGHKGAVWSARLSDDATLAATGSADFSARVWDTFTGEALHVLQHNHIVRAVAFPPGEKPKILATGGMEKKLRVYDLSRDGGASSAGNGAGANGGLSSFPANGSGADVTPSYEIAPGAHQGAIKSIIWSRGDSNLLTTAADDKKIRWWDLRTRSAIASHDISGAPGSCELSFGRAEESILSVAAGKDVYLFHGARPGELIKQITTERDVASVAVNTHVDAGAAGGGGRRFVAGSPNDTWVHVWDLDGQRELETGKGHHGPVWTTAFSPDGKLYATGSEDGTVKLWKFTHGPYGLWR